MKSSRTRRQTLLTLRPLALIVLVIFVALMTFLVPPQNGTFISIYILLMILITYLMSTYFFSRTLQLLITAGMLAFLVMNIFVGFSLVNTAILISLVITISQLVKK